jgi:transcription initiation factor TFIIE subunit beta
MTQVHFAIVYMKDKDRPLSFSDIQSHLSLQQQGYSMEYIDALRRILQSHEKVEYEPSGANSEGSFRFRPPHNIRSAEQLLAKLQAQPTAQGMNVRELREGWSGSVDAINQLEKEGKILVTRNKKDDHPKMVWANDPSLIQNFDSEFRQIWEKIRIPDNNTVAEELEKAGITPTSKHKIIAAPKVEKKKVKKQRRSGKTTNVHMAGVLRDYSHLKR